MANEPGSIDTTLYAHMVKYATPDNYTIVQTIDAPVASWLITMTGGDSGYLVNKDFATYKGTAYGVGQDSLVGTGPFVPAGATAGSDATYTKNPNYYLTGYPHVDAIQFLQISDAASMEAAFVTGKIDVLGGGTKANATRIQGSVSGSQIYVTSALQRNLWGMEMNLAMPIWQDVRVRQAIRDLWPQPRIISDLMGGAGVYNGCVGSGLIKYSLSQDELKAAYAYDPATAKSLLTQAGYSAAKPLVFPLITLTGFSQTMLDQAAAFKAETDATGMVTVNITPLPVGPGRAKVMNNRDFTASMNAILRAVSWDDAMRPFDSTQPLDYMNLKDPKVDAWYAQQGTELDETKRIAIFKAFDAYCADQVTGAIPTPEAPGYTLDQRWLKNYPAVDFAQDEPRQVWAWIDKSGS